MRRERAVDLASLALLTAAVLAAFFDVLFLGRALWFRDLSRVYYPERAVLHQLFRSGHLPLWNPLYAGGQPVAANPGFAVWYPPQWLMALPNLDLAFRLEIVLHYLLAAIGMYLLCRALSLRAGASLFGAVSFAFGGMLLASSSMLPTLFSLAWWPWIALACRRALRSRRAGDIALSALALGMVVLIGDPVMILLSGLGVLSVARRKATILIALAIVAGSILVGAGQIIPALDLKRDSGRAEPIPYPSATFWSMPPIRAFELFYPNVIGRTSPDIAFTWSDSLYHFPLPWLISFYPGLLAGVAAVAGILRRRCGSGFAAAAFCIVWLVAIGSHGPLFRLLYLVTGGSVRYPEHFFVAAIFAVTLFAAVVAGDLFTDARLRQTAAAVALVAAIGATILTFAKNDEIWRGAWWPSAALAGALALILVAPERLRAPLLAAFVIIDLAPRIPLLLPTLDAGYYTPPPLAAALQRSTPRVRIYSAADQTLRVAGPAARLPFRRYPMIAREALLPEMQAIAGFGSIGADDVTLMHLLPSRTFHDVLALVRASGRTDRLPLLMTMAGVTDAVFLQPDFTPRVVAFPNDRCWFADAVEQAPDPRQVVQRLLSSDTLSPHIAFIDGPPFPPAPGRVLRIEERWNTFDADVDAAGRALLVLCITPHRYWRAAIDGRAAPLIRANVGFQALVIPPGRHHIAMQYENPLVVGSAIVTLASVVLLAVVAVRAR